MHACEIRYSATKGAGEGGGGASRRPQSPKREGTTGLTVAIGQNHYEEEWGTLGHQHQRFYPCILRAFTKTDKTPTKVLLIMFYAPRFYPSPPTTTAMGQLGEVAVLGGSGKTK